MKPADADEHNRRRYEAPALGDAILRQIAALVARCEEGDTEALEQLARVDAGSTRAQFEGARALYRSGYSWQAVGDLLGVTRQAAWLRFRTPGETGG